MNKAFILSVFLLILATACTSTNTPSHISTAGPSPLPVSESVQKNEASLDSRKLRQAETLKAYSLGRRVDANDSSLMYEGGIVYRLENDSAWNLQPAIPENIPYGGKTPASLKDNKDALRAEIEVKVNEQRALYQFLKEAGEKAEGQIDALKVSARISRQLLEQNKVLKQKILKNSAEKKKLESEIDKLKNQIQALLNFYRQKQEADSRFRRTP